MQIDLTGVAASLAALVFGVGTRIIVAEIRGHIRNAFLRDLLESAVNNALGRMEQASAGEIADAAALHPTIDNPLIAVGVRYVAAHADEALQHFGVTPDAVADKIEARLGLANMQTKLAIAASPLPSAPAAMDPLPVFPADSMKTADLNEAELAAVSEHG